MIVKRGSISIPVCLPQARHTGRQTRGRENETAGRSAKLPKLSQQTSPRYNRKHINFTTVITCPAPLSIQMKWAPLIPLSASATGCVSSYSWIRSIWSNLPRRRYSVKRSFSAKLIGRVIQMHAAKWLPSLCWCTARGQKLSRLSWSQSYHSVCKGLILPKCIWEYWKKESA